MNDKKKDRLDQLVGKILNLNGDEMIVLATNLGTYQITFDRMTNTATMVSRNASGHPDFHAGPLEIFSLTGILSAVGIENSSWTIEPIFEYSQKIDKSTIIQTLTSFITMSENTGFHSMLLISGIDPADFNKICENYKVLPHTRIDKIGRYYYTEITAGFPASVIRLRSDYLTS